MRVARHFCFQPGAHKRRLRDDQRHTLTLHVGTHQRTVRIVMLQKRNQTRRHRNELFRRDVHVMHFRRIDFEKIAPIAHGDFFTGEMAAAVDRRVRLRDQEIFLAIAGQIFNLVGHASVLDFSIRRLNESELVDSREGTHRADQSDVRSFRCFDRTNPAVVRRVNVAHFEPGPVTRKTPRAKGG